MEKAKNLTNKLFELVPGGIFGLLSVAIGICGDIIPILLFPGGYNMFENMISELGVSPGGIFFNLGLIISGIVAIPFYISLGRTFREENINGNLRKSAVIFSIISCVSFILIGVFPAYQNNNIIFFVHGTSALISWITGLIYCSLFGIMMLKDNKFSKLHAYFGFIVAGAFGLFLLTWTPITEWILTLAVIFWIIVNSFFMLYHKI